MSIKTTILALTLSLACITCLPQPSSASDLPQWWDIDNPTALNIHYPLVISCIRSDYIRLKLWLPLGPNEPHEERILDPQWHDIRIHTAWDPAWVTIYGGNHVDIAPGHFHQLQGGWQIIWSLDIPVKWSDDLFAFQSYSVRFINSWVDFEPFEGVDKVVMLSWQCRTFDDGPVVWGGIQRQDLPETPPTATASMCH